MTQILPGQMPLSSIELRPRPFRTRSVGVDIFATHTVTELRQWPDGLFAERGFIRTPMIYDAQSDRYRGRTWQTVLSQLGAALVDARLIIIVGNRLVSAEMEALQSILASWTSCPVDLLLCIDNHNSGHVRLTIEKERAATRTSAGRTLLLLMGSVPPPSALDIGTYDDMVCITNHVSAGMFQVTYGGLVLPMRLDGWRLSHIAFHRLIDIEAEQFYSQEYSSGKLPRGALPLCSIIAETRRHMLSGRNERTE